MTAARGAAPLLEHVFDLHVDVAEPVLVDRGPAGARWFIAITGGRLEGPALAGRVLPGGGDWADERGDGTWDLDARYTVVLDDGTPVEVRNRGTYREGPDGPVYYLTAPWFRTAVPAHRWLTETVFVGEAFELGPTSIRIEVHAVRHARG